MPEEDAFDRGGFFWPDEDFLSRGECPKDAVQRLGQLGLPGTERTLVRIPANMRREALRTVGSLVRAAAAVRGRAAARWLRSRVRLQAAPAAKAVGGINAPAVLAKSPAPCVDARLDA